MQFHFLFQRCTLFQFRLRQPDPGPPDFRFTVRQGLQQQLFIKCLESLQRPECMQSRQGRRALLEELNQQRYRPGILTFIDQSMRGITPPDIRILLSAAWASRPFLAAARSLARVIGCTTTLRFNSQL